MPPTNELVAPETPNARTEVKNGRTIAESKQEYYDKRIALFEKYFEREQSKLLASKEAGESIVVTLPDGTQKEGVRNFTTPLELANSISKSLAKKSVVARVDGVDWDLTRPLEQDCSLELFSFDTPEGKEAFWHSSSHVLGLALELEHGVDLTVGPAIDEGFYYDCFMGEKTLHPDELPVLESKMNEAIKAKYPFQRIEVSKPEALSMFQENKFKLEILNGLTSEAKITVYRCGPMVDLCTGPHLPTTEPIKAISVNSASRAFWRADVSKEPLQRVYGVTFPDPKQLKEYKRRIEEAKKRDHRLIGNNQELFFFHHYSPGSCFFQPSGTKVYNALVELMREKYWEYEYEEVITPNIFNFDLWKKSGHADHYKENMFSFDVEKQEFGLKPMNCPGHCLIFGHRKRSYRELPLRLAEFGVLHRNEFSGALQGLTRVRKFVQDDSHIYCRPDQVQTEVHHFLKFMDEIYGILGLDYTLALSTRPAGFMGEISQWDQAESALKESLETLGSPWELNPEDGAFYGPKIDITVFDALRRKHQCATVQLDFQLPIKFDLEYQTETGMERPVIVHRAILGSIERMYAILTEHFAGKWPLWLSPRQVMIVPVSEATMDYAVDIKKQIRKGKILVEVDTSSATMQKKVRAAQLAQFNYILVVGEQEKEAKTVNVRTRDNAVHGMHSIEAFMEIITKERDQRCLNSAFQSPNEKQGETSASENVTE
eukprot:g2967.t1